jgi:copper transport protein
MVSDTAHILAVGTWLGTLLILTLVAVPLVRRQPEGHRSDILAILLYGFSPLALIAGSIVLATGVFASTLHLNQVADLWQSSYGRLLLAKILLVSIVFTMGAYNWRRVRPRAADTRGDSRLLKSAGAELTAAVLVIGLTAVLVAVPPPADVAQAPQSVPQAQSSQPTTSSMTGS